jgi:hypothetical protein
METAYDGQQVVRMDLHRRTRTSILRGRGKRFQSLAG